MEINWTDIITKALPEGAKVDESSIGSIITAVQTANQGLVNKRDELLGTVSNNAKKLTELQNEYKKFDNLDLEGYNKFKESGIRDNLTKGGATEDYVTLKLAHDKLAAENKQYADTTKELNSNYEGIKSRFIRNAIDTELSKGFDRLNVKPELKPILLDAYRSKAEGVLDGENIKIVMRDGDSQLETGAFLDSWSKTDNAKAFISANTNIGGGANGSSNQNGTTKNFSEMTLDEQTKLYQDNKPLYDQLNTQKST
jgi:hypothetical protein